MSYSDFDCLLNYRLIDSRLELFRHSTATLHMRSHSRPDATLAAAADMKVAHEVGYKPSAEC